jgi:hypothetical protein
MVLIVVVGRDLACFWSGRAFGGEFGYMISMRNIKRVKQTALDRHPSCPFLPHFELALSDSDISTP